MPEEKSAAKRGLSALRDVSGTTIAVTSLAILGAAALVTTPLWLWRRHKRKQADELIRQGANIDRTRDDAAK